MALFKKGNPGRPKGSKNKKRLLTVEEILLKYDVNPIQKLIEIAQTTEKEEIQRDCWKEISKYTYAQKKSVEATGEAEINITGIRLID